MEDETMGPIVVDSKRNRLIEKFLESGKWPIELEIDFIEAFKKCPALWAKQSDVYRNPIQKASQLQRLSLEFPGLSESTIENRIRSLKDTFVRIHKQITLASNPSSGEDRSVIEAKIKKIKSKWIHYERCEFFTEHIKHRSIPLHLKHTTNENSQESTSSNSMGNWFTSSMTYPERWQGANDPFGNSHQVGIIKRKKGEPEKIHRAKLMKRQKEMADCYMDVDSLMKTMEKQEESLLKREQLLKTEKDKLSQNPLFNYILGKEHVLKKINPNKIDDLKFELDNLIDKFAHEHPI